MGWSLAFRSGCIWIAVFGLVGTARGGGPPEVQEVTFQSATLSWSAAPAADFYNVYRGLLSNLATGVPATCHGHPIEAASFTTPAVPAEGEGFFYLVTAESAAGEGSPGTSSAGQPRALLGACTAVMRNHVLDRLGYGWNEWTRDRLATLGVDGYIAEQLDPDSISEADNTVLATRMAPLTPPANSLELIARQVVTGTYGRRQLAEQSGNFWTNHFNTEWVKTLQQFQNLFPQCGIQPQCDPAYPARSQLEASTLHLAEFDGFQSATFAGSFREILELSAKSPAMIIYLDTYSSIAAAPNENYARELLELHALGVDGGYTQQDVEELARVFTGWSFCKKQAADLSNPVAPCIANYWEPTPAGAFVANFITARHDCGQKVLFQGSPQQVTLASTCGNPTAQVAEVDAALDAVADHPSTAQFISTKILQRFVTDDPDPALVAALVAQWNDPTNPAGVGDLREVLAAALELPAFLDPDQVRSKVKTPLEHFVSALRATRGVTDGFTQVFNYLTRAQHLPYLNPVPTGWPEHGDDWLDTNNTLERQNFGLRLAALNGASFGSDPIGLLSANGVSTAPGNSAAIVDFLANALFGGALTPAERQAAIVFLDTNDSGTPSNYNSARIRDLTGFLLGYGQFQEQ